MVKNGIGMIYIADNRKNSNNYYLVPEEEFKDRAISLYLKPKFAKELFKKNFKIIELRNLLPKKLWNYDLISGQFYIIFKK